MSHGTYSGEIAAQPPKIDFAPIADFALREGGIFVVDAAIIAQRDADPSCKMPASMLETPYENGPVRIELEGEDVPKEAMHAVRKNFRKAGELLMPEGNVALYFHERFTTGDILHTSRLQSEAAAYKMPTKDGIGDIAATSEMPSFHSDDPSRKVYDKRLFTADELTASWDFSIEHPEAVLSVITYKTIMLDYFANLRHVYETRANANLKLFDNYARQWETDNFTGVFVPALTVLYEEARSRDVEAGEPVIDQAMFSQALGFVIGNRGFQNWVTVPAEIALDGTERTNQFVCPAVGPISDHLGDGAILARIHGIISQRAARGDEVVGGMLEHIRQDAQHARDQQPPQEYLERHEREKYCDAIVDGQQLTLRMDWDELNICRGSQIEGDLIVPITFDDTLTDVVRRTLAMISQTGRPAYFAFNEQGYRFTPERLRVIARTQHPNTFVGA